MLERATVLSVGLVMAASAAAAQPPPPPPPPPGMGGVTTSMGEQASAPRFGAGAISGIVTDGVTGAPIEGALVALTAATGGSFTRPRQMTDSRGRYIFTHLPASGFGVIVVRPGYLDGGYGRVPGVNLATRIDLDEREWMTEGHVQLWKTASISGLVSDERGEPLVGIPVRILARTRVGGSLRWVPGSSVTTDDRGHYRIPGLLAGDYIVHVPSVQVTLPTGVIALYTPPQRTASTGAATPTPPQHPPDIVRGQDGTGVIVGHYATPDATAAGRAYPMMFHPASRTLDAAEVVAVAFGDERRNVDVHMQPVSTVSVSGQVIGPVESIANLPVRLLPLGSEALGTGAEAGITRTDAQGGFTFQRVPDGEYTILASRTVTEYSTGTSVTTPNVIPMAANAFLRGSNSMPVMGGTNVMLTSRSGTGVQATGRAPVSVGQQPVTGLTIPLSPSVNVSGHFEWDGSPTPPEGLPIPPAVRLEPADGDVTLGSYVSSPQPRITPGETPTRMTFRIENVLPGEYVLGRILGGGLGWALASAEAGGRDVLSTPLVVEGDRDLAGIVIRLTAQRNSLTGSVRDGLGGRAAGRIIAFPAAADAWQHAGVSGVRFANATIQADGTYTMSMLLPGDYYVAAIPLEDRYRSHEPDYLAAIAPQATRITVTPSSILTQDLRMITLKGGR
jgi:hypothetical protein